MVYHVEIRRSLRRARAFNLSEKKLFDAVVEPWRRGLPVELGDQRWESGESVLRILEGPELAQSQLALSRGWSNAERTATDVTTRVMREAASAAMLVAVIAATASGHEAATALLDAIGVRTVPWATLRARIVAAATVAPKMPADTADAVALLVLDGNAPGEAWLFDAGLALGALGGRAIVAQLGDDPSPTELRELAVIRIDAEQPASMNAHAERLRHATAAG